MDIGRTYTQYYSDYKMFLKQTSPKEYGEYLAKKSKRSGKNKKHSIKGCNRK